MDMNDITTANKALQFGQSRTLKRACRAVIFKIVIKAKACFRKLPVGALICRTDPAIRYLMHCEVRDKR